MKIIKDLHELKNEENFEKIESFDYLWYFLPNQEIDLPKILFYNKIKIKNNKNIIKYNNYRTLNDQLMNFINNKEIDLVKIDNDILYIYDNLNHFRLNQISKVYLLKDKEDALDFKNLKEFKKKFSKYKFFIVILSLTSEVIYNITNII